MRTQSIAIATVVLLSSTPAFAGELEIALGASGEGTSWDGDAAGYGTFFASYRFNHWIAAFLGAKLGYASVDERALQYLELGAEARTDLGPIAPFVRLAALHQHEVSRDAAEADFVANLGGWGDGIRHRGGLGLRAGVTIPLFGHDYGDIAAVIEGGTSRFLNAEKGPLWYWGGGAGLALTFDLGLFGKGKAN